MLGCVELQNPSEFSTELIKLSSLQLLKKVFDGFSFHPLFFILNLKVRKEDQPIKPYAHQTELLFRLQFRKPIRVLIGDEIGLGKTIEGILIGKFLEDRDGIRKVLILVPRILVQQWISELERFYVNAKELTREYLRGYFDLAEGWYVASIDLVKREEYREKIAKTNWDLVIADEAHRIGMDTDRYELVEELAKDTNRNIVLLSATPHRGNVKDYLSRLRLIDPYLTDDNALDDQEFYKRTINSIVIRRTKMDVNEIYEKREIFKKANLKAKVTIATEEEKTFYDTLFHFLREKLLKYHNLMGEEPKALPLLLTLIAKRASSSPQAAIETLDRILSKRTLIVSGRASSLDEATKMFEELEQEEMNLIGEVRGYLEQDFDDYENVETDKKINTFIERIAEEAIKAGLFDQNDIETIGKLKDLASKIMQKDSRLNAVLRLIRDHVYKGDKVVVFTEYKDTAKYVYDTVKKEISQVALITSEGIKLPDSKIKKPTIEDVKDYLKRGKVKVIISTDVASEGLNLQIANVLINYEPSWSPIKIEQRLGRVWRLGQDKEVFSYTIFLGTDSDRDVLEILYKKLLAQMESLNNPRVSIGEEIEVDSEETIKISLDSGTTSTNLPLDTATGKPKYTEYKAIMKYMHGGRKELESYVGEIINTLQSLKRNAEKLGLTRQDLQFRVDTIFSKHLNNLRDTPDPLDLIFREMVIKVSELKGEKIHESGSRLFIGGAELEGIYDYYQKLSRDLSNVSDNDKPIYLLSSKESENIRELHLFKVTTFLNSNPTYSEIAGVKILANGNSEIARGKDLIKLLSDSLSTITATIEEYQIPVSFIDSIKTSLSYTMRELVNDTEKELMNYVKDIEKKQFSYQHKDWRPRDGGEYNYRKIDYIGSIIYLTSLNTFTAPPPPYKVKEIEKKAMEFVMEYEKNHGRDPQDVSDKEHYDILSRGKNEIRYIEVKGKAGLELHVELTQPEFNTAKEKGENYWLYIVYGLETGNPRVLVKKDPIRTVKWNELNAKRYIFSP